MPSMHVARRMRPQSHGSWPSLPAPAGLTFTAGAAPPRPRAPGTAAPRTRSGSRGRALRTALLALSAMTATAAPACAGAADPTRLTYDHAATPGFTVTDACASLTLQFFATDGSEKSPRRARPA